MRSYGHGLALTLAVVIVVAWAALMGLALTAAAPPADGGRVVALFPSGRTDASFAAIIRSGGRPIGRKWAGLIWAVDTDPGGAHRLKAEGAIAVFTDLPLAAALGCAASVAEPFRPF
jgi:hypothetical protein